MSVPSRRHAISTSQSIFARMIGRQKMLATVFDPAHRAPQPQRRKRNQEVLGIEFAAHAEAAAHVALDHLDRLLGQAEHAGKDAAVVVGDLAGAGNDQRSGAGVILREDAARLHGKRGVALRTEAFAPHVIGAGECRIRIADRDHVMRGDIGAVLLEQQVRVARGRGAIGDRRDAPRCRSRSARSRPRRARDFGDHDGDRFSDEPHLVLGDDRLDEPFETLDRSETDRNGGNDVADIGGGEDRLDAGHIYSPRAGRCCEYAREPSDCARSPRATVPRARYRRRRSRARRSSRASSTRSSGWPT